jgi:hypothetical protein
MAPTPSVKIVKEFAYRGDSTKRFSNRYHFNGGTPADHAHWETLFDAIVADEVAIYNDDVTIVEAVGYLAGMDVPEHQKTYSDVGTGGFSFSVNEAGDVAVVMKYGTLGVSVRNHPIYLFSFYHGAKGNSGGGHDDVNPAQITAMEEYGQDWLDGFSDGTITATRASPNGLSAVSKTCLPYLSHRDFPR